MILLFDLLLAALAAEVMNERPLKVNYVDLPDGKRFSVEDVTFGYDLLYERNALWAQQRWMGVQCQQNPSDAWILQEILFDTQPDLLIETGTQNGGGSLFYASMMQMYDENARVLTIDTMHVNQYKADYSLAGFCSRMGCKNATDNLVWQKHVTFIHGSSTSQRVLNEVRTAVQNAKRVMVVLDSLHKYENVLRELREYSGFVSHGQYLVVQDTKLDRIRGRPLAKAAVNSFLQHSADFKMDRSREYLLYSQHHDGYLIRK